jgi:hypothetical protein
MQKTRITKTEPTNEERQETNNKAKQNKGRGRQIEYIQKTTGTAKTQGKAKHDNNIKSKTRKTKARKRHNTTDQKLRIVGIGKI